MRTLFFVVNQDLADGSAHALYCLRHCWWLAATNNQAQVRLIHSGRAADARLHESSGLGPLPNLSVHALPGIRKPRGGRGLTINAVYHWAAFFFLRKTKHSQDILASASFPKLFRFLCRRKGLRHDVRTVYEVHQLALLEHGPGSEPARIEREVLDCTDVIMATTRVLLEHVQEAFPDKATACLGLGCGFAPEAIPARHRPVEAPLTVAYVGSLYEEQGVRWLVQSWPEIQANLGFPCKLKVIGGPAREVDQIRRLADLDDQAVELRGPVPPGQLAVHLETVDALVIPALLQGRMPYVAITKAYDYLGLNRPIVATDLPSIREVLRPGKEALLFNPGDQAGLAKCLNTLLTKPLLASTLLANCRERSQEFSWQARARQWWDAVGA